MPKETLCAGGLTCYSLRVAEVRHTGAIQATTWRGRDTFRTLIIGLHKPPAPHSLPTTLVYAYFPATWPATQPTDKTLVSTTRSTEYSDPTHSLHSSMVCNCTSSFTGAIWACYAAYERHSRRPNRPAAQRLRTRHSPGPH